MEDELRTLHAVAELISNNSKVAGLVNNAIARSNVKVSPGAYLMLIIPLIEAVAREKDVFNENGYRPESDFSDTVRYHSSWDSERRLYELGIDLNQRLIYGSLEKLILTIENEPAEFDNKLRYGLRTSISAIKAFWRNFCNIPPFCGETKE